MSRVARQSRFVSPDHRLGGGGQVCPVSLYRNGHHKGVRDLIVFDRKKTGMARRENAPPGCPDPLPTANPHVLSGLPNNLRLSADVEPQSLDRARVRRRRVGWAILPILPCAIRITPQRGHFANALKRARLSPDLPCDPGKSVA